MAKSNKQRQWEWREWQKRNNLEEYRAKELHRVQSYKSHQNQSTFLQKHHEAPGHWHECKRILQGTPVNISPAKVSQESLGNIVKHVTKALPKSPSKKESVVCAFAKYFRVMNTEKKVINWELSACDKVAIQNFYWHDEISLYMPGKQDAVKRVLAMTGRGHSEKIPQSLLEKVNLQNYDWQRSYCHQKCPATFVAAFTMLTQHFYWKNFIESCLRTFLFMERSLLSHVFATPLTKNKWLQTVYFARLNSKQHIWMKSKRNIIEQQPHGISGKKARTVGQRKMKRKASLKICCELFKTCSQSFAALLY